MKSFHHTQGVRRPCGESGWHSTCLPKNSSLLNSSLTPDCALSPVSTAPPAGSRLPKNSCRLNSSRSGDSGCRTPNFIYTLYHSLIYLPYIAKQFGHAPAGESAEERQTTTRLVVPHAFCKFFDWGMSELFCNTRYTILYEPNPLWHQACLTAQ